MRRMILVLVAAAVILALVAASATAKPKTKNLYCAEGSGPILQICAEKKEECELNVAANPESGPYSECQKQKV